MLRKAMYAAVVALSTLAVWPNDADAQVFVGGRNWGVGVGYPTYYYGGYYGYPSYYYSYPSYYYGGYGGYYGRPYYNNYHYGRGYYGGGRGWRHWR